MLLSKIVTYFTKGYFFRHLLLIARFVCFAMFAWSFITAFAIYGTNAIASFLGNSIIMSENQDITSPNVYFIVWLIPNFVVDGFGCVFLYKMLMFVWRWSGKVCDRFADSHAKFLNRLDRKG
jgi:hypothetical protein